VALTDAELAYLQTANSAAMITVTPDGVARPVRVSIALVDGKIWSSSTLGRVRTKRLRVDPRATLFVFEGDYRWLAIESAVTILEGDLVPVLSVRLFRTMQDRPEGPIGWFGVDLDEDEFRQKILDDDRIIYEFDVVRTYGMI
jgi:hypothetical protein